MFSPRKFTILSVTYGLLSTLAYSQSAGWPASQSANRDSIDRFIAQGLHQWHIPGMALVLIKDGQIVIAKGYGYKSTGRAEPVTTTTRFPIASNTKLFTGVAAALLEQQHRINLDTAVIRYLPDLKMSTPELTQMVTMRDLLSHRLGTRTYEANFCYYNSTVSRSDVVRSLAHMKATYPFRQTFGYSNTGYVSAGEAMARVTGKSWDELIQELLLTPLGMGQTKTDMVGLADDPAMATGYTTSYGDPAQPKPLPYDQLNNIGATAAITTSITDLSKWLFMQLDSGRYQGRQIVPWPVLAKTREGNTIVSSRPNPNLSIPIQSMMYGLGTFILNYRGTLVYSHTGRGMGFLSYVTFCPEKRIGIGILMNQDDQNFGDLLQYALLDTYWNLPLNTHAPILTKLAADQRKQRQQEQDELNNRVAMKTALPLPVEAYCGTFYNQLYGQLTISPDSTTRPTRRLNVRFEHHPTLSAWLDYMDGDTFRLSFSQPRYGVTLAKITRKGHKMDTIDIRISSFLDPNPYVFQRESTN